MYKIIFIDKYGKHYDGCEFGLIGNENLPDKLEEVLYIMQELTPVHREWMTELFEFGGTTFTYHNLEYVHVSMEKGVFYVADL